MRETTSTKQDKHGQLPIGEVDCYICPKCHSFRVKHLDNGDYSCCSCFDWSGPAPEKTVRLRYPAKPLYCKRCGKRVKGKRKLHNCECGYYGETVDRNNIGIK